MSQGQEVKRLGHIWRRIVPPRAETWAVGTTIVLAGVVGVLAALLALALGGAVRLLSHHLFFGLGRGQIAGAGSWRYGLILLPAAVFLVVAYCLNRWAPEASRTGISQVMSAVGRAGGFIRRRVIFMKPLMTALCIGVGAPLGMEGPVVHTGAAVGSLVGARFKMGVGNIRILVAAGAAAGLAARYGAPIGGAVFSAELILGSASTAALMPLIVASFLAVLTRNAVLGGVSEYRIPTGSMEFTTLDYGMFVLLGLACGLAAAYFIKMLFATEDLMDRLFAPWWAKALGGGLVVGLVGFAWPDLLGTGHGVIQRLLEEPAYSLRLLLLFVLLKPLLCATALGSGASGGIFAPSLFMGAALGALVARLGSRWLGLPLAPAGAYALVGMAAVMGAVMRAPLQAVLVAFELTHSYAAVPALMIACVLSLKLSEVFEPESAFTRWLVRQGERIRRGMDFSLLDGTRVRDVIDGDFVVLPAYAPISDVGPLVRASENRTFPVVDERENYAGLVMLARLLAGAAQTSAGAECPTVGDLMEPEKIYLEPNDSLARTWRTMGNYDYDCLPVCRRSGGRLEIVGICEKEAIVEMHDRQAFVRLSREAGRPHGEGAD